MTEERDDLDDPGMRDLLRGWCRQLYRSIRTGGGEEDAGAARPFQTFRPPRDLSRMHRALDAAEEDLARRRASAPGLLARWLRSLSESARSLGEGARGWWSRVFGGAALAPLFADLRLSLAHDAPLRGGSETEFRSGERVHIHFHAGRACQVFVAMLDSRIQLVPVGTATRDVRPGPNRLGPFRLDENAGTESFILLASASMREAAELRRIVEEAARAIAPSRVPARSHEEELEVVVRALRSRQGLAVQTLTFLHRPE